MVDISITPANVVAVTGTVRRGTAGMTLTAGMALYRDSADGNSLKAADADVALGAAATVVGIALHGASDGQPISYLIDGTVTIGGTVVVGELYVLSGTAGGIAPEADLAIGDYVSIIGVGTTTARIKLGILNSGVAVLA